MIFPGSKNLTDRIEKSDRPDRKISLTGIGSLKWNTALVIGD